MLRSVIPWSGQFSRDLARMDEEIERLFPGNGEWWRPIGFVPRADVAETENGFEVKVELPGLKPEEVRVEFKDGALWISGEKKEESEEEGKTFHRVERRHGEFRRMLTLPSHVEEEQIEARFEDGLLHVVLPKSQATKARNIEVRT